MIPDPLIAELDLASVPFHRDEPLAPYTYWKIGGPADILIEPASLEQLSLVLSRGQQHGVPFVIIGDGTNILVADEGYRGAVIRIGRRMSGIEMIDDPGIHASSASIRVSAGSWVPEIAHTLGRAGYSGLEHTIGIPGTFGGLIFMNGGSRRHGIGEVIESVTVVTREGIVSELLHDECQFAYRSSRFQETGEIIVGAIIRLQKGDRKAIIKEMHEILAERRRKFPRKEPSCGSVFVSDPQLYERFGPPGKVIEDLGFKGMRVGGAMVSERHANFVVNAGDATADDVMRLTQKIEDDVKKFTGVRLKREFRYLGQTKE